MLEPILNRWRGTGIIFSISNYGITGANIYALYYALVFGYMTKWYIGLLMFISFRIGESFSWGKWVGYLCSPNEYLDMNILYQNKQGYSFPYIHYIANFIVKEKESFREYAQVALFIRGLVWAILLYMPLYLFNYISIYNYAIVSLLYAVGFPYACYLGSIVDINYKSKYLNLSQGWENQEVIYGFIHFICNIYLVGSICLAK